MSMDYAGSPGAGSGRRMILSRPPWPQCGAGRARPSWDGVRTTVQIHGSVIARRCRQAGRHAPWLLHAGPQRTQPWRSRRACDLRRGERGYSLVCALRKGWEPTRIFSLAVSTSSFGGKKEPREAMACSPAASARWAPHNVCAHCGASCDARLRPRHTPTPYPTGHHPRLDPAAPSANARPCHPKHHRHRLSRGPLLLHSASERLASHISPASPAAAAAWPPLSPLSLCLGAAATLLRAFVYHYAGPVDSAEAQIKDDPDSGTRAVWVRCLDARTTHAIVRHIADFARRVALWVRLHDIVLECWDSAQVAARQGPLCQRRRPVRRCSQSRACCIPPQGRAQLLAFARFGSPALLGRNPLSYCWYGLSLRSLPGSQLTRRAAQNTSSSHSNSRLTRR